MVIKFGEFGRSVRQIQHRLCIVVNGYFDKDTLKAVKSFQSVNKLEVDGLVGVKTVNALFPDSGGVSPDELEC